MKHYLIYIPGLGDKNIGIQAKAVTFWRLWGVKSEAFHMKWYDDQQFEPKLQRLVERVRELLAEGYTVSLVGASAGGSAAINAYAELQNDLHGVVLIAGAIHSAATVNPVTYQMNPSFKTSMYGNEAALEKLSPELRQRIYSAHAITDAVVYPRNSKIEGAAFKTIPAFSHVMAIVIGITLYAPVFIRWLKRLN